MTPMRGMFLSVAAAMAAVPPTAIAAVSGPAQALATVQRFDDTFNKGDGKAMAAMCAPGAVIIDDFAPHVWKGASACADWWTAIGAFDTKSGVTDGIVTLRKPWHVDVTGNRAYVVAPTTYTYKQNGKPVVESGSVWTLVLDKAGGAWRVAGWSWAQH